MPDTATPRLSGVAETLLIPLYNRAMETRRPDAMVKDEKAAALVRDMSYDFGRIRMVPMTEVNKALRIMQTRQMDRCACDFLNRHPDAVVVHIGCGLDSRFERVDNGRVEWYDLDLPDVIELRRRLIGDERPRYHLLPCSVLDGSWQEAVMVHTQRPFLFLAEAVLVYFTEAQVKSLVLALRSRFPGAELVFDGYSRFGVWAGNRQLSRSRFAGLLEWRLRHGREMEGWGNGIRLLGAWGFFDKPEKRLAHIRWLCRLSLFNGMIRIYRYQLGAAAGERGS